MNFFIFDGVPEQSPFCREVQKNLYSNTSKCSIWYTTSRHGRFYIKSILIRSYKRGYKTLLVPGSDLRGMLKHKDIYEKELKKQGRSRFGMNDKDLYKEIFDFVISHKHIMEEDIKKLGISCDWSRNKFTLDKDVVSTTCDTFIKMYKDGLIYRGERCIHWNPKFQTSLSDIETKFKLMKIWKILFFEESSIIFVTKDHKK